MGLLPPATYLDQLQRRTQLAPCMTKGDANPQKLPPALRRRRNRRPLLTRRKCWADHSGGGLLSWPPNREASARVSRGPQDTLQPQAQLAACSEAAWPSAHRPWAPPGCSHGLPHVPAPSIRGLRGSPVGGGWRFDTTHEASGGAPQRAPRWTSYCCWKESPPRPRQGVSLQLGGQSLKRRKGPER